MCPRYASLKPCPGHGTVARVLVAVRTPRSEPVSYSLTVRTPLSLPKTQVAATGTPAPLPCKGRLALRNKRPRRGGETWERPFNGTSPADSIHATRAARLGRGAGR